MGGASILLVASTHANGTGWSVRTRSEGVVDVDLPKGSRKIVHRRFGSVIPHTSDEVPFLWTSLPFHRLLSKWMEQSGAFLPRLEVGKEKHSFELSGRRVAGSQIAGHNDSRSVIIHSVAEVSETRPNKRVADDSGANFVGVFWVDTFFPGDGGGERSIEVTSVFQSLPDGSNRSSNKRFRKLGFLFGRSTIVLLSFVANGGENA